MSSIKKKKDSERRQTVFVGLSGGVDSSVAAFMLQKIGFNVVGVYIRGYNIDGCSELDAESARRAAGHLGIPFYVWDMEEEYKKAVVDYMIEGYRNGITPNPDVMCNKEIKFGIFLKRALMMGADFVATGHYVRSVFEDDNKPIRMFRSVDDNKDQSYFLWTLGQKELAKTIFPVGWFDKKAVRHIAKDAGLPNAERKDSQGICFLGKVSMPDFLKRFIEPTPGEIITTSGEVIGEHKGLSFYTIGQRHMGLSGLTWGEKGSGERKPIFVSGKDPEKNLLIVAEGEDDPALFRDSVSLSSVNFISGKSPESRLKVKARVRYRQPLFSATLIREKNNWTLLFDKPVRFVAPGQSAVFYSDEDEMIGGGIIV